MRKEVKKKIKKQLLLSIYPVPKTTQGAFHVSTHFALTLPHKSGSVPPILQTRKVRIRETGEGCTVNKG